MQQCRPPSCGPLLLSERGQTLRASDLSQPRRGQVGGSTRDVAATGVDGCEGTARNGPTGCRALAPRTTDGRLPETRRPRRKVPAAAGGTRKVTNGPERQAIWDCGADHCRDSLASQGSGMNV